LLTTESLPVTAEAVWRRSDITFLAPRRSRSFPVARISAAPHADDDPDYADQCRHGGDDYRCHHHAFSSSWSKALFTGPSKQTIAAVDGETAQTAEPVR
jgi:hypothetical protein